MRESGSDNGLGTLLHLLRLSRQVANRPGVWGIAVYSALRATEDERVLDAQSAADSGFEGVACVDDVARAAVLALRLYQVDGTPVALKVAKRWLEFVQYMQMRDGRFCNFILDWRGSRNERGPTSFTGGGFWTARALWALGAAYQVTGEARYQQAFRAGWSTRAPLATDIEAVHLLGGLAYLQRSAEYALAQETRALADKIAATTLDGYLVHRPDEPEVHLWGYDQVTALVAAARYFEDPAYLRVAESTAQIVFRRQALEGPCRGYPSRQCSGVCAYDVSACCRGLGALYAATGRAEYAAWLWRLIDWFDGSNAACLPLYRRDSGRCHDGIDDGALNPNCGAESAIEAGLVEVERRLLLRDGCLRPRRRRRRSAA